MTYARFFTADEVASILGIDRRDAETAAPALSAEEECWLREALDGIKP